MVLRTDYCLYYYKDPTKKHLGAISLRDPNFRIRVGQKSDVSWPKNADLENSLVVVTTPRVYFMFAESRQEAEKWKQMLEMMHKDLVEVTRSMSFSSSRSESVSARNSGVGSTGTGGSHASYSTSYSHSTPGNSRSGSRNTNVITPPPMASSSATTASTKETRAKPFTSITESTSSISSFGRQLQLSTSSEIDGGGGSGGLFCNSTHCQILLPSPEETLEEEGVSAVKEEEERGKNDTSGMATQTEKSHHTYLEPPLENDVFEGKRSEEGEKLDYDSDDDMEDYVVPPDALSSYPQNLSVRVESQPCENSPAEIGNFGRLEETGDNPRGLKIFEIFNLLESISAKDICCQKDIAIGRQV